MNRNSFLLLVCTGFSIGIVNAQLTPVKPAAKYKVWTAKKPAPIKKVSKWTAPPSAIYPKNNMVDRQVVYQYIDTTFPNSENQFPVNACNVQKANGIHVCCPELHPWRYSLE